MIIDNKQIFSNVMKNMKRNIKSVIVAALTVAMVSLGSCKSASKATNGNQEYQQGTSTGIENISKSDLQQRFAKTVASYKDWTTFKASGKVVIGGKKQVSSTMQISMVKGECITVSIKPMLGIELGKIYITNDSVIILNKMEKYYIAENLKMIAGGVPLNIDDMQNVLLARMFELGKGTITTDAKTLESITPASDGMMNVKLSPKDLGLNYTFSVKKSGEVRMLTISFNGSISDFFVNYYDFNSTDYGKIADTIEVTSRIDNNDLSLKFQYDPMYVEWNKQVRYGNPIDARYRRIDGRTFLNSWAR